MDYKFEVSEQPAQPVLSMRALTNPLVVVLLGMTVLKEKLTRWQVIAIVLAAIGVLIITLQYGKIPWVALSLAVSFVLYGLIKKIIKVDSITGCFFKFNGVPAAVIKSCCRDSRSAHQ